MVEFMNVFGGSIGPFLETIMGESVHDNMIMVPDESLDDAKPSKPSRRVNQQRFHAPEFCQFLLKLHIISDFI